MIKKISLIIILLFFINSVYAQSIGVTPKNNITIEVGKNTSIDFGVSQGSENPEKITIEGDYSWLYIPERSFILESKTGKSVVMSVYIKRKGVYTASLKVCGSDVGEAGGVLSAKACAKHTLTVNAYGGFNYSKRVLYGVGIILLLIGILIWIKMKKRRGRGILPAKREKPKMKMNDYGYYNYT